MSCKLNSVVIFLRTISNLVICVFFIYTYRFKDFADAVVLCAKLGAYMEYDEVIVTRKAKAIVDCFIDSQVPPKTQASLHLLGTSHARVGRGKDCVGFG